MEGWDFGVEERVEVLLRLRCFPVTFSRHAHAKRLLVLKQLGGNRVVSSLDDSMGCDSFGG